MRTMPGSKDTVAAMQRLYLLSKEDKGSYNSLWNVSISSDPTARSKTRLPNEIHACIGDFIPDCNIHGAAMVLVPWLNGFVNLDRSMICFEVLQRMVHSISGGYERTDRPNSPGRQEDAEFRHEDAQSLSDGSR